MLSNDDMETICNVWTYNLEAEFKRIRTVVTEFPFISMVNSIVDLRQFFSEGGDYSKGLKRNVTLLL